MKKWVMFALLLIIPNVSLASVSADFFTATDTAATSTFSSALSADGVFKYGGATGILTRTNGYVSSTPNFVYNPTTGFLGVGTSTQYGSSFLWEFVADTSNSGTNLTVTDFDTVNPGAQIQLRSARGTRTAATAVLNGNSLGAINFTGFDGTSFPTPSPVRIAVTASETWTATGHGGQIGFLTTANGTTTRVQTMTLSGNGNLSLTGTSTINGGLAVGSTTILVKKGLSVDGEIYATGASTVLGNFTLFGTSTMRGSLSVGTTTSLVQKGLTVDGDMRMTGTSTIVGGLSVQGNTLNVGTSTNLVMKGLSVDGNVFTTGYTITKGVMAIGTSSAFVDPGLTLDGRMYITGNIGIGTASPLYPIDIIGTGTTSIRVDSSSGSQGSCIIMKDSDGAGYTYLTANDGVLSWSATPCN